MNARERVLRDFAVFAAKYDYPRNLQYEAQEALAAADASPDAPVVQVPDGPLWDSVRKNAAETDTWPQWKRDGSGLQMGPRNGPPAPMTAERRAELVEVMRQSVRNAPWTLAIDELLGNVLDALVKAGAVR